MIELYKLNNIYAEKIPGEKYLSKGFKENSLSSDVLSYKLNKKPKRRCKIIALKVGGDKVCHSESELLL